MGLGIGDKFEKNDENISDNINEEENDENKNENLNENINEEINENNLEEENDGEASYKNDDDDYNWPGHISLRKPIFWKTKIDKGNSKKFNVFRLNTVC